MTRRIFVLFLIILVAISSAACTAPTKTISGIEYRDYGILNPDDRNPNVHYEPNWWNVVIAIVFFEMIVPPIYVFGFHLMKPVGPMPEQPGQVR